MKILFLPGYRYPNSLDEPITCGDLRYSFTLSRALAKLGHDVTVISRKVTGDSEIGVLDGVKIYRYRSELSKLFATSFDISFKRYRLFKKLHEDVDIIVCNTALSLEHLVKVKKPILYIASGLEDVKNYSLSLGEILDFIAIKFFRDPLKRLTWKKSSIINTTAWGEDATLKKWGIPAEKIGKISSSVDQDRFFPQKEKAKALKKGLGIADDEEIILSVSRFTPAKGVIETIRAFDLLNRDKATLLIVGLKHSHSSSYYSQVQEAIASAAYKDKIILQENVADKDLPLYYSVADVTSVFSKGYDPLPTVIIESMACGVPVVSTYYKTREQFIEHGKTGYFVAERDLRDWVTHIADLLENNAIKQKISQNALSYVSANFNSLEIAKKILTQMNERST